MNVKKLDSTKIYWLDKEETVKAQLVGLDMPHGFGSVKYTFRVLFGGTGDIVYMDSNLPKTIHEVVEQKPWQFTTPIAMKCTEEQFNGVKDKLIEMGYKTKHITFCSAQRYIATCYGDESNLISDLNLTAIETSQTKRINTGSFNPDLFLALAAMTDKEDGIKGEWWKSERDFAIQGVSSVTGLKLYRKATAQEIIEHFEKKEFVLPEKWCVEITDENVDMLWSWTGFKFQRKSYINYVTYRKTHSKEIPERCIEITFDQFKKYVLKETEQSCQKTPVIGSGEYTVNVEFDAEKAAEELFEKIVEWSNPKYESKIKGVSERTINAITEHFIEDNNRLRSNYVAKNIQKVWNESIEHVKGSIALPIPSAKQATVFDDRVEITNWNPKEGDTIFGVYVSPNGITYEKYEYFPHMEGLFDTGFIKRTESEAKQLVEKLKQAML